MNGPCAKRAEQPIKTAKWLEFDTETGEYLDCPVNKYGEPSNGKLFGLFAEGRYWLTRAIRWEVKRPKQPEPKLHSNGSWLNRLQQLTKIRKIIEAEIGALPADTAYTREKLNGDVLPPRWSFVNNCTTELHPILRYLRNVRTKSSRKCLGFAANCYGTWQTP